MYLSSDWLACAIGDDVHDAPFHHRVADFLSWPPAAQYLDEEYRLEMARLLVGSQMRRNHRRSTVPEKSNEHYQHFVFFAESFGFKLDLTCKQTNHLNNQSEAQPSSALSSARVSQSTTPTDRPTDQPTMQQTNHLLPPHSNSKSINQ